MTEEKKTEEKKVSRRKFIYAGAGVVVVAAAAGAAYYLSQPSPAPTPTPTLTPVMTTTATTAAPPPTTSAPPARYAKVITVGTFDTTTNLDPAITGASASLVAGDQVCDKLFDFDPDMNVVPALATKYEVTPDGKTWTFYLRQGVKWQKVGNLGGKDFTADDVQFTFERVKALKTGATFFPSYDHCEIVDSHTIKIINSAPFAPMISGLGSPYRALIMPNLSKDELATIGGDFSNTLIGTGPYMLVDRKALEYERFEKFADHWRTDSEGRKLPYSDELMFRPQPDASVRLLDFRGAATDIMLNVDGKDMSSLQKETDKTAKALPGTWWAVIDFCVANQQTPSAFWPVGTPKPPFNDVRMRQAVHYALDKQEILNTVLYGLGEIADSPLPSWNPYYYQVPGWRQDIDKAKKLMADAGYANGWTGTFPTYTIAPAPAIATVIQAQLAKVNINLKIQTMDTGIWLSSVWTPHNFNMAPEIKTNKIDPWTSTSPYVHTGSGYSTGLYSDAKMDALLDSLAQEVDDTKRKDIAKQLQIYWMEQTPLIPLVFIANNTAWYNYEKNFRPHPNDISFSFKDVYVQK